MKIGKREKKALILGGIAVFFILSYLLYDWFIGYTNDLRSRKDAKRLQLIHLIGKIAEKGETEKRITGVKTELEEVEKGLIPGDKPAVGAAELQKILKDTASSAGIEIRSERILNPIDINDYSIISVEVAFVSTTARFRDLIYSIETSPFILVIPDMKIRVTNLRNPTDIQVNLTVRGLIKRSGEGEKKEESV
jgi:hypothetical protein